MQKLTEPRTPNKLYVAKRGRHVREVSLDELIDGYEVRATLDALARGQAFHAEARMHEHIQVGGRLVHTRYEAAQRPGPLANVKVSATLAAKFESGLVSNDNN